MDVAAKPVELGDDNRGLVLLGQLERLGELRPSIESVAPLAGLNLAKGFEQLESSASAKRASAACCASRPRPDRPWLAVDTRV